MGLKYNYQGSDRDCGHVRNVALMSGEMTPNTRSSFKILRALVKFR